MVFKYMWTTCVALIVHYIMKNSYQETPDAYFLVPLLLVDNE